MSVSGVILAAQAGTTEIDPNGVEPIRYYIPYFFSVPIGGATGGAVRVNIQGKTETELNAEIQQAIADQANEQTFPGNFTSVDVVGGRI